MPLSSKFGLKAMNMCDFLCLVSSVYFMKDIQVWLTDSKDQCTDLEQWIKLKWIGCGDSKSVSESLHVDKTEP